MTGEANVRKKGKQEHEKEKEAKESGDEDSESKSKSQLETGQQDTDESFDDPGEGDTQLLKQAEEGNNNTMKSQSSSSNNVFSPNMMGEANVMKKGKRVYEEAKESEDEDPKPKSESQLETGQQEKDGTGQQEKDGSSDNSGEGVTHLSKREEEGNSNMVKSHSLSFNNVSSQSKRKLSSPPPQTSNPNVPSKVKRPRSDVEESGKENKRRKTVGIPRIFAHKDEIVILKGLVKYLSKTSTLVMKAFLEFIKKSLTFESNKSQLYEKVRRLRKKYEKTVEKGGPPKFSTRHEKKIYRLSGKIWGERGPMSLLMAHKKNGRTTEEVQVKVEVPKQMSVNLMSIGDLEEFGTPELLDLVKESKRVKLEEKRKDLDLLTLAHFLRQLKFKQELGEAAMKALKLENEKMPWA